MEKKSGVVAGLINMILPGGCHVYLNDNRRGWAILTLILAPVVFAMIGVLALFVNSFLARMRVGPEWLPSGILALVPFLYLLTFFSDGRYWARRHNKELAQREAEHAHPL